MMGSLISRRKRKTKVEAKSVSVQERSFQSSPVNNEQSTEVKVTLEKAKPVPMEVNIGDGQLPCPESPPRQTTNENRKRKVGFPKSKIKPQSGKNHTLQSNEGCTQYDVFGVPYQVIPLEAEARNAEGKHQSLQSDLLKVEDISAPNDNPHQEKLGFPGEGASLEGEIPDLPTDNLVESRAERQDHTSNTQRKTSSPRLQRRSSTSGSRRASQEFKGSSQKYPPPNKLDTDDKSSGLQRKAKTMVESIGDNSESSPGPPWMVNTAESTENVSHENVFREDELTGMTAIISRQLLSPYGYYASLNPQTAEMRNSAKTTLETKNTEAQTGSGTLPQPANPASSSGSEIKKDTIDGQEKKCQDSINDEESKIAETDICPDGDIDEDTLDWNVDDRVRSPLDPGKEEDSDSLSCQEVIAKSPNSDNEEGQEDLVVKGYCRGSGTSNKEEDLAEDTLDTNVDDRIHSPSDSRSSSDHSSDEEDDTIDMLVNGTLGGAPSQLCQQQSSLTTLKDGDSADNSIYTPLSKSPSHKTMDSAEIESTVSKDLSCGGQHPLQEKEEHSVPWAAGLTPQGTAAKRANVKLRTTENHGGDLTQTVAEDRGESVTLGISSVESGSEDANHCSLEGGSNQGNVDHGSSNTSHCKAGNETLNTSHRNSKNKSPDSSHSSLENGSLNTNYSSMDNGPRTTSHSSLESEPQGISFEVISSSINIKPPQNDKHDLAAVNDPKTTDLQRKDHTSLKEPGDFHDSPENATESPKLENPSGKLLMNVGDGTLPHGDEDLSKTVLEVQEAEAMTLLLITGTLPCEANDDVERGAGDGQSLDVNGADKADDTKDADKRTGLAAATTNTRFKSSCQLEQLQAEHSQLDNTYNTASFNPQPPQRNQSTADDVSAACAIPEDQPQALPHVTIAAGRECRGRPVPVDNSPGDLVDHGGAAAASFVEERTEDGLVPPRRTSPGAASSERDCQTVQAERLHQRVVQSSRHGRVAAGASSSRPHTYASYSEGTGAVTLQTVAGRDTDSSATFIEVQTVATTEIMAQSQRGNSNAQQRDIVQPSNSTLQRVPDQNQRLPSGAAVLNRHGTPEGAPEDMKPDIQESNGREATHSQRQPVESAPLQENRTSTVPDQQPQTSEQLTESSASNAHPDSLQHNPQSSQD